MEAQSFMHSAGAASAQPSYPLPDLMAQTFNQAAAGIQSFLPNPPTSSSSSAQDASQARPLTGLPLLQPAVRLTFSPSASTQAQPDSSTNAQHESRSSVSSSSTESYGYRRSSTSRDVPEETSESSSTDDGSRSLSSDEAGGDLESGKLGAAKRRKAQASVTADLTPSDVLRADGRSSYNRKVEELLSRYDPQCSDTPQLSTGTNTGSAASLSQTLSTVPQLLSTGAVSAGSGNGAQFCFPGTVGHIHVLQPKRKEASASNSPAVQLPVGAAGQAAMMHDASVAASALGVHAPTAAMYSMTASGHPFYVQSGPGVSTAGHDAAGYSSSLPQFATTSGTGTSASAYPAASSLPPGATPMWPYPGFPPMAYAPMMLPDAASTMGQVEAAAHFFAAMVQNPQLMSMFSPVRGAMPSPSSESRRGSERRGSASKDRKESRSKSRHHSHSSPRDDRKRSRSRSRSPPASKSDRHSRHHSRGRSRSRSSSDSSRDGGDARRSASRKGRSLSSSAYKQLGSVVSAQRSSSTQPRASPVRQVLFAPSSSVHPAPARNSPSSHRDERSNSLLRLAVSGAEKGSQSSVLLKSAMRSSSKDPSIQPVRGRSESRLRWDLPPGASQGSRATSEVAQQRKSGNQGSAAAPRRAQSVPRLVGSSSTSSFGAGLGTSALTGLSTLGARQAVQSMAGPLRRADPVPVASTSTTGSSQVSKLAGASSAASQLSSAPHAEGLERGYDEDVSGTSRAGIPQPELKSLFARFLAEQPSAAASGQIRPAMPVPPPSRSSPSQSRGGVTGMHRSVSIGRSRAPQASPPRSVSRASAVMATPPSDPRLRRSASAGGRIRSPSMGRSPSQARASASSAGLSGLAIQGCNNAPLASSTLAALQTLGNSPGKTSHGLQSKIGGSPSPSKPTWEYARQKEVGGAPALSRQANVIDKSDLVQSLGSSHTRSGRVSIPPLEKWRGIRQVVTAEGQSFITISGSLTSSLARLAVPTMEEEHKSSSNHATHGQRPKATASISSSLGIEEVEEEDLDTPSAVSSGKPAKAKTRGMEPESKPLHSRERKAKHLEGKRLPAVPAKVQTTEAAVGGKHAKQASLSASLPWPPEAPVSTRKRKHERVRTVVDLRAADDVIEADGAEVVLIDPTPAKRAKRAQAPTGVKVEAAGSASLVRPASRKSPRKAALHVVDAVPAKARVKVVKKRKLAPETSGSSSAPASSPPVTVSIAPSSVPLSQASGKKRRQMQAVVETSLAHGPPDESSSVLGEVTVPPREQATAPVPVQGAGAKSVKPRGPRGQAGGKSKAAASAPHASPTTATDGWNCMWDDDLKKGHALVPRNPEASWWDRIAEYVRRGVTGEMCRLRWAEMNNGDTLLAIAKKTVRIPAGSPASAVSSPGSAPFSLLQKLEDAKGDQAALAAIMGRDGTKKRQEFNKTMQLAIAKGEIRAENDPRARDAVPDIFAKPSSVRKASRASSSGLEARDVGAQPLQPSTNVGGSAASSSSKNAASRRPLDLSGAGYSSSSDEDDSSDDEEAREGAGGSKRSRLLAYFANVKPSASPQDKSPAGKRVAQPRAYAASSAALDSSALADVSLWPGAGRNGAHATARATGTGRGTSKAMAVSHNYVAQADEYTRVAGRTVKGREAVMTAVVGEDGEIAFRTRGRGRATAEDDEEEEEEDDDLDSEDEGMEGEG